MEKFTLRGYQEEDVQLMIDHPYFYNCNDMGLGKTLEALEVRHRQKFGATLIVAPKIAKGVWRDEAYRWYGWGSVILDGPPLKRKQLLRDWKGGILIINPAQIEEILNYDNTWDMIIVDEAHTTGLLNHKSKFAKLLCKFSAKSILLLSGTPVRRNLADIYSPLHVLNPKKFKSYWQFVEKYCITSWNGFGNEILGKPKNPIEFKNMLKYYMIRRKKEDVLEDLPEKIRSIIPLDMSKKQKKAYDQLAEEMMLVEDEAFVAVSNAMGLTLRLRQMLICPKMLGVEEYGTAIESLGKELIPQDFEDGRSVIVCTPFKKAIPFVKEYFEANLKDYTLFEIHGDIKELASDVAKKFQAHKSHRKVLIYTIKSGASFTATDASMVYFLGAEWSNTENNQAEDRCYRIGQKRAVDVKYLCYNESVDDEVKLRLQQKNGAANWVLDPQKIINKLKETVANNRKRMYN